MSSASPRPSVRISAPRRSGAQPKVPSEALRIGWAEGFGLAYAAVLLVVWLELLVVLLVAGDRLSTFWELYAGLIRLAPVLLLSAALAALVGTAAAGACVRAVRSRLARGAVAGLLAGFAALVAWGVSTGRHFESWPLRVGFVTTLAAVAAAGGYLAAPHLGVLLARGRWLAAGASLLVVFSLELINRFVLVRLYPAFHLGLSALTAVAAVGLTPVFLALRPSLAEPSQRARRITAGILIALVLGLGLLARRGAEGLSHFDNLRLLLTEQAPLVGHTVELAAWLAPPEPLQADACVGQGCESGDIDASAAPRSLDWRGRDLLLISVDALRADHVGAYGYDRKITPNIDELARKGAVFLHAYAPTPHTSYSVTSMMTGKYMRPLLLQGSGQDSDTWATLLRTYGYRTAAFYPPAVFFIDTNRFQAFRDGYLGFEYRKVEFLEGPPRVAQVDRYLSDLSAAQRTLIWVHLFGPHEPYEAHPAHPFGDRDVDRYDSEIAAVDQTVGELVGRFRQRSPDGVVIITADHGEEFGEHGGRYHGTTVYEEQVRVPLIVSAPGSISPVRLTEPVQTIDLLPTVLSALEIPKPPRIRGRDLGPLMTGKASAGEGFAFSETEERAMLAIGASRLVCERKLGACRLYDLAKDPTQQRDFASEQRERFEQLRQRLNELTASHGRYEVQGLRAEGKGWPSAILRGIAGEADAAPEIAMLLDDADRAIRRKAAELLFELRRPETAPALRLALSRDEDPEVRNYSALGLTRLGEGAPLAFELARSADPRWRRLAALALAETGDKRGEGTLIGWWLDPADRDFERSREILHALGTIRSKDALWPLVQSLDDVRLRPYIARALAAIGDEAARGALANALAKERYQGARVAIARALVDLGAEYELAPPLARFLGVPDPLPGGLEMAMKAGILEHVGGPKRRDLSRLRDQAGVGVALQVVVPRGSGESRGVRALARVRPRAGEPGEVRIGLRSASLSDPKKRRSKVPRLDPARSLRLEVPAGATEPLELYATLPPELGVKPGYAVEIVVFADRSVELEAVALVPLAEELPPPAPEPWHPGKTEN